MGLDMYAYTIKAELIGDQQVDIPLKDVVRKAVGFTVASPAELASWDKEVLAAYYEKERDAAVQAREAGLYDPELAYWRKFNHLHGWMNELYDAKGGVSEQFNCSTVRLMPHDLDLLEEAARAKTLRPTQGFFFGSYEEFTDDDRDEVLEFVAKAREAINNGMAVIYDSWW